jgi:phosphoserine phosphatase
LRHDPEFRAVRREHLREVGKRVRLKDDLEVFARVLREHLPARFHFCVISASPREVVRSVLEGIVPAENIFGTEFAYDDRTGEISGIVHVPAGYGKVAVLEHLQSKLHCTPDRTIYVGDGSSDLYVMHHVNSHDGLTVAVSETKSIARIARRSVLSENALSVLVPILEETLGWSGLQIRDLFTSCDVAIHEWNKIRTDWVTFQRIPTPFVLNETEATDSKLLPAASLG